MARFFYSLILYLLSPLITFYLYILRGKKNAGYRAHFAERFGFITVKNTSQESTVLKDDLIVIHCASVGEVLAATPLLKELQYQQPSNSFMITCNTPTGREQIHNNFKDSVQCAYLPIDYPCATARFLKRVKPTLMCILETELWPNLMAQCKQQNIPEEFVRELVPGFVMYWRERNQARFSWGNAFYKFVLREWRGEQTRRGARELETEMSAQWWPSEDAVNILVNSGINATFIEDAIPEFVLYWRERGVVNGTWNTRFIEHIRRQWGKYSASIAHDTQPRRIAEDWQPSPECFDILLMAEIDESFAKEKISEFVLYWRDTNQVHASWNTRFLQFIKYQWARRLESSQNLSLQHAENQSAVGKGQQDLGKAFQRFTDRSWAE